VAVESRRLAQSLAEDDDDENKRRWQPSGSEQAARSMVVRRQRLEVKANSTQIEMGSMSNKADDDVVTCKLDKH